ncbi:MAG: hypothetical protein V4706_11015 [Pseudomonadota bacterium]
MIALLPIRGWVGDVMATEMASTMATQPENATKMVAAHAHGAGAEGQFDHETAPQQAAATMPDCPGHGDAPAPATHASCDACQACQACHTVALTPPAASPASVMTALAPPHSPVARFASADMAPGQKPPIS